MDVESNISTPTQRRQPAGNTGEMSSNSELSSLQQEINTLREFIHAEDKRKKQPSWIRIFCSQLCERTMKGLRASTGLFGQCFSTASARMMLNCIIVFVCGAVFYDLTLSPHSILRRGRSHEMADKYTLVYKGHIYRTLRPGVEVDSFENSYLESGRTVLTCPVRFPVPDGWALVPEDDVPDVLINVVSKHYWGSAAMVLNKFAAYPTLSLIAQVSRPYPQATNEPKSLTGLVNQDPFQGMGPWFDVINWNDNDWVMQNLLPANTRECLMIVFSFASRGYRDDHVEDVVPACELCSTNILIRKAVD
ncbi:hypothetical protein B484DRAFT_168459 [Ochromonadaceae sp. CCMP2298]|nr:hypothetical protein B484DRAFT_168459 [Ochromonadaceae sp. CCMP2298]